MRRARELTGPLCHSPTDVEWRRTTADDIPPFLRARLDAELAQGTGWKFAPLQFADAPLELALDNDCILWRMPAAVRAWLAHEAPSVLAEDVSPCFGRFAADCGTAPRNSGLRGLAAGVPFAHMLEEVLDQHPGALQSELDEQGLQVAAVTRHAPPLVVTTREVSICSPLAADQRELGTCGAHFVGVNSTWSPWKTDDGRPITEQVQAHWARMKDDVAARVCASSG
jgi:hypothetical protein